MLWNSLWTSCYRGNRFFVVISTYHRSHYGCYSNPGASLVSSTVDPSLVRHSRFIHHMLSATGLFTLEASVCCLYYRPSHRTSVFRLIRELPSWVIWRLFINCGCFLTTNGMQDEHVGLLYLKYCMWTSFIGYLMTVFQLKMLFKSNKIRIIGFKLFQGLSPSFVLKDLKENVNIF
jgi:hypothetical protein